MNRHKECVKSAKVGDILHIACSSDNSMTSDWNYDYIGKFPIVGLNDERPIVISKFYGDKVAACGRLIKIEKKR